MAKLESPLGIVAGPLASLNIYSMRVTASVVGRSLELASVERELTTSRDSLFCFILDGEPGIGKTRVLLAIDELARTKAWTTVGVTTDEEIRGPFLLARSMFGSLVSHEALVGTPAAQAVERVCDALSSIDDPGLEGLAPDRKLVRVLDLAAVALRVVAAQQPLVILVDDFQWADEDSLRMLRYVVRTDASSRILLILACRRDEVAFVNEAVTLMADMERMGLLQRLSLGRFSQHQSTEFLQQVLGGQINQSSAAAMHVQAEGVPFILAEQVDAYRDAGMIQQIDGIWTLTRNAERLLPSAVRTLIQRRAARLPEATRTSLAEAAVLGRSFSLRDLHDIKIRLNDEAREAQSLAESLAPAVAAGMLVRYPDGSAADYSFTHGRIREYATATLTPHRRRAIHEAVVQILTAGGQPAVESLALLAQHALAAGRAEMAAQVSVEAARNALQAHAPEEVLRLVDLAQPVASGPQDRVELLRLQDDALNMLRRPAQRLEALAQLAALAEALQDPSLKMEVMLRRAAALRLSKEYDRAAELALRVRQLAAERQNAQAGLAASLELGQNLLRTEIGEGYAPAASEVDLDGGAQTFQRAATLAEELGDDLNLAAVTRELGVIAVARLRSWFVAMVQRGEHIQIMERLAAGERYEDILPTTPAAPFAREADAYFRRALEIYERLGDRRGTMAIIIAMAYLSWGPEIHMTGGAKRIEEIRRLATRMKSLTTESERELAEAQMLYGAHVYSGAKVFPDTALAKGEDAYSAAQTLGDRSLEFTSAGGVAMANAEIGAVEEAERWLDRAVAIASTAPTALRARLLESWRGRVKAAAGDADGMREHLEHAVQLATNQGLPAARCEALARLALEAARLGADRNDEQLLAVADGAAQEAKALLAVLPGHPPWGAQADAAIARVALAWGAVEDATVAGRAALDNLEAIMTEDLFLDVQLPAAEALLTGGTPEEAAAVQDRLRLTLTLLVPRILDEDIRVRWLQSPIGRELTKLSGPLIKPALRAQSSGHPAVSLTDAESGLLRLLTQGLTNREIARELGSTEESVTRQLAELFTKIGASSRADATASALIGKLV